MNMDTGFSRKQDQGGFAPLDPPLRAQPLEPLRLRNDGRHWRFKIPERPSFRSLKNGFLRLALGGVPRGRAPWPYLLESPHP
jgi:hypothetical protein